MDNLLTYTPEPFDDLNQEAGEYEFDLMAGEWEAEEAEDEEVRRRRGLRPARGTPRNAAKRWLAPPGLKPSGVRPKLYPRLRPPRLVQIPLVPPLIAAPGSEYIRWVQDCLNRTLGLQLPVDGNINRETRGAVRTFQERQGLPISGLVGPDTEAALKSACADAAAEPAQETAWQTPHPVSCNCPSCNRSATMNHQLSFQPFSGTAKFEEFDMEADDQWQGESTQESLQRIRWIQESLNRILGLKLKADGIMGPQTRSAIRNFQQKQKLLVDGIAGPATIRALMRSGATTPPSGIIAPDVIEPAAARLWDFDFDKSNLKPTHLADIDKIADKIVASWSKGKPFFTVKVIGHTDPEGSPQYNQNLGLRRALAVRTALQKSLKKMQSDLYYKVLVLASSRGESERIDITNTPRGQARNRRVEIFLSTKALKPLPKPKPPKVIELPPIAITGTPPRKCDPDYLNRSLGECEKQIRNCIKKCEADKSFIWNKIKDNVAIAGCFALVHPLAIAACALPLGGIYYKELIDEYFRLSSCQDDCKLMLDICQHSARLNAHCS